MVIIVTTFGLGAVVILIMACVCCKAQLKCHRKDTKMAKEGVACKSGDEANSNRIEGGCNVAYRSGDEVSSMIGNAVNRKSGDEASSVKMKSTTHDTKASVKMQDNMAYLTFM